MFLMRRRIFIAINLPEDIKKKLVDCYSKWPELPCHWTKKDNLHITLMFLGYLSAEELLDVCKIANEVARRYQSFSINLNKICYGPPQQRKFGAEQAPKKPPRMVWAEGEESKELGKLQKDLEDSLLSTSPKSLKPEARPYVSHITLGRIKTWEWRQIEPEERPEIDEEINLSFEVGSIEIMESQLKRGGAEYAILEICQLKS